MTFNREYFHLHKKKYLNVFFAHFWAKYDLNVEKKNTRVNTINSIIIFRHAYGFESQGGSNSFRGGGLGDVAYTSLSKVYSI